MCTYSRNQLRMITRPVTRCLGAAMVVLLLGSCADTSENRIIIWTSMRPVERAFLQEKLDEFGENYPGYQFTELRYEPEELRSNYMISALAGKGPALVHVPSDQIGPLHELRVIMPLEAQFDTTFLDSFLNKPFPANTWFQGHLLQISDRVGNHLCLIYNKDLIAEPPETINELIEVGKEISADKDGDGLPDRYALAWNFMEPFFVVPFIGLYGGWIINDERQPTLDTEPVRQAAQLIYDLANKHKIIPRECDYETANALFMDGQAAMIINGPWAWGTYLNAGMNIGIARIPRNDETGTWATPIVSPMGYAVNVNLAGEKLEITMALLRYLTSEPVQLAFARKFNLIPSRRSLFQHPDLTRDELYNSAVEQMMVGREMPVVTELRWIWDGMRPAYQGIFTGHYTPVEAAREMQRQSEKLIRANRDTGE